MIYNLPNYLILHFKRTIDGEKVNNIISFPINDFQLNNYVLREKDQNIKYDLIGLINHYGSGKSGHFIAVCKKKDKWFQFNDSEISEFDSKNLINENNYCLFYKKKNIDTDELFNGLF